MAPKSKKADELQQKSPAEFFADNKNIAGFDNVGAAPCCAARRGTACAAVPRAGRSVALVARAPANAPPPPSTTPQPGKCLYTTVRELVENALDSAESISRLPEISLTMCAPLSNLGRPRAAAPLRERN
jgi:hypothetical protein